MAISSQQAKTHAKNQLRDEKGHFIKSDQPKAKVSLSTPADIPINPEFEKPLVQLSITNPFRKILYWLDQIRRHQTTTFAIKLSIPLIALPIFILAVFQLGRLSGISFQKTQTTPWPPLSPTPQPAPALTLSRAGVLKVAKGTQMRFILALKNGDIINLQIPERLDLLKYQNKQILVTGTYNRNTNLLTVSDIAEIELFNTLVIPQPTIQPETLPATPSASPQSLLSP